MPYTISMKHPHFPDDHVFGITGLGRVTNDGTPLEIDEETELLFVTEHRQSLEDRLGSSSEINLTGSSTLSPEQLKDLTTPVEVVEDTTPPATNNGVGLEQLLGDNAEDQVNV